MTAPHPPQHPHAAEPDPTDARPWWKKKRFALPAGAFIALLAISPFVPSEEDTETASDLTSTTVKEGDTTTALPQGSADTEPTTTQSSTTSEAPTTTQPTTTTTTTTTESLPTGQECEGGGASFTSTPGTTCDEVYAETERIMRTFDGFDAIQDPFIQSTAGIICTAMNGVDPVTYEPESTYIPAVADALVDDYCPGDRSRLVLNN